MEIPPYVWYALGAIVGVVILYFICLRLASNDWIGVVPPGPCQIPYFGSLFVLLSNSVDLVEFMSRKFLQFGHIVKFSVWRHKFLLVDTIQTLNNSGANHNLETKTPWFILFILTSLGINVPQSQDFIVNWRRVLDAMYNFTIPMEDFKDLLDDIENFHRNQEKKKIEKLLFECIKTKISLDTEDLRVIQDCTEEIGYFTKKFIQKPKMFFPFFRHFPGYLLERKRVYKSLLEVEEKLRGLLEQKLKKNPKSPELDEETFKLLQVSFFTFHISYMIHQKPKETTKKKSKVGQNIRESPDSITSKPDPCDLSFLDVCGLQVYKVRNYIKLSDFDIPQGVFILVYNHQESDQNL